MKNDEVEKQVEEAMACNCGSGPKGRDHWVSCPAWHRPAVLALLERRENEHAENIKAAEEAAEKETANEVLIFLENFGEAKAMGYAEMLRAAIFDSDGESGALARHDQRLLERREQELRELITEWKRRSKNYEQPAHADYNYEDGKMLAFLRCARDLEANLSQPELGPCGRQHPKSCWVDRCPTCESPARHLHPAIQHEGEVQVCTDQWHESTAETFCTACAELGPCPRHGKEFWVDALRWALSHLEEPDEKEHNKEYRDGYARSLALLGNTMLEGGNTNLRTACAQEKAAPGGVLKGEIG